MEGLKWKVMAHPTADQGRVFQVVDPENTRLGEPLPVLETINCIHQPDDAPLRVASLAAAAPELLAALKSLIEQAEAAGINCHEAHIAVARAVEIDGRLLPAEMDWLSGQPNPYEQGLTP